MMRRPCFVKLRERLNQEGDSLLRSPVDGVRGQWDGDYALGEERHCGAMHGSERRVSFSIWCRVQGWSLNLCEGATATAG
jgi:hypothetical protein